MCVCVCVARTMCWKSLIVLNDNTHTCKLGISLKMRRAKRGKINDTQTQYKWKDLHHVSILYDEADAVCA